MSRDQAYYDARWSTPVTELGPVGRQRVLFLRQTLAEVRKRVGRDLRILDFGCGQGHYAAIAADFGNVLAIDLSPVAIQHGRASYPHVEFRVGDVLKCDLPGPFDVVLSIEVLEHVRDQLLYITCLASLLAAGGPATAFPVASIPFGRPVGLVPHGLLPALRLRAHANIP